ncbi:MAG TPA: short-chain dehydrogenase [Thermoanaerobaculia bacterium]|nr:short-chain dehydrogenase [Thermoanaerobaculia bacterium]
MDIEGKKILVLGGYGLVGTAVCRELLRRQPREIQIHSLRQEESEAARDELAREGGETTLSVSAGDIFGLVGEATPRERARAQIGSLGDGVPLERFLLYRLLVDARPDVVIDCVNTATGIAYRDAFRAAELLARESEEGTVSPEAVEGLLEALYVPRLIRHVEVLHHGMHEAGTRAYAKVGTSGTGGLGLNIPYTHSEERPSRVLMSKSAIAGAQSMLLFLMARTPGAPLVKEIKPAAAIAWKKIGFGPIHRRRQPIWRLEAEPRALGPTFSTEDPGAARVLDEVMENVFVDSGENGLFALEEFATVTSTEQMEFVTPEEIAHYLVLEIEGHATGYDVIAALDGSVLGPSYRAGALRHAALERMRSLEERHGVRSVAFEMLGPPRVSKLLYEAHLLRETFGTLDALEALSAEQVRDQLDSLVRQRPELTAEIAAVGLPVILDNGEVIRGPQVLVPQDAREVEVTPEKLEGWVRDGWVDLRLASAERWMERLRRIREEWEAIGSEDTSSRHVRNRSFWNDGGRIEPAKLVGWILTVEEGGNRTKR